jgi:hypothetical protein
MAELIVEVFGVNEHAVHSIAGPLVQQIPCEGGCEQVGRMYRSHSDLAAPRTQFETPNSSSVQLTQSQAATVAGNDHDRTEGLGVSVSYLQASHAPTSHDPFRQRNT